MVTGSLPNASSARFDSYQVNVLECVSKLGPYIFTHIDADIRILLSNHPRYRKGSSPKYGFTYFNLGTSWRYV
jgi:hypothetical protein